MMLKNTLRTPCSAAIPHALRDYDAAEYLGVSRDTLRVWRQRRSPTQGPVFVRFGRSIRYLKADLDAWVLSRRIDSPPSRHDTTA
jgi:excisionase family DNA binding protein